MVRETVAGGWRQRVVGGGQYHGFPRMAATCSVRHARRWALRSPMATCAGSSSGGLAGAAPYSAS